MDDIEYTVSDSHRYEALKSTVCFGEVLWDILPTGALPGGAPMNVAYHLNQLGVEAKMISGIGDDEEGRRLLEFMKNHKIPTDLVQKSDYSSTGTVLATQGENHEMVYDIVKPAAYDFIDVTPGALDAILKAPYFIFGSLAVRNEHSRRTLKTLINLAETKVFDINLRAPHYDQNNLEQLLLQTDILKLNEHEIELVSGWYADISRFEDKVRLISDRYQIARIIVTKGAEGASYFDGDTFYHHPGFTVTVADTIGSGDAFLAAFLSKLINGATPGECVEFACKLGAYVATQKGACPDMKFFSVSQKT